VFQFPIETPLLFQLAKYFAQKLKGRKKEHNFTNGGRETVNVYHAIMWDIHNPSHCWLLNVTPRLPESMVHYQLKQI
jgi:hypothetical protein